MRAQVGKSWLGLAVLVVLVLAGTAYWYWMRPPGLPEEARAAQRALAGPDALLVVTADLSALSGIEPGDGTGPIAELQRLLATHPLGLPELQDDARHVVAALYPTEQGSLGSATVLLGAFDPAAIESALQNHETFTVDAGTLAGEGILLLARVDPDACEPVADWALHVTPGRVAIGGIEALEAFLLRSRAGVSAGPELEGYADFSAAQLVSALLLSPAAADAQSHPVVRALQSEFRTALDLAPSGARIGLSRTVLPGELHLQIELASTDGEATAAQWIAGRDSARHGWSLAAPTLAALHDALEIESLDGGVRATASVASSSLSSWYRVPDESVVLASRSPAWAGTSSDVTELDPRAREFRELYPPSAISRYDRDKPLAGPGDVVAGPFGLHVRSVRRSARPGAGLAIELEAYGPALANLGESTPLPRIVVDRVTNRQGENLLLDEPCGVDRNGRPVALEMDASAEWMRARKPVRLIANAALDAVDNLAGHMELSLPVRTAAVPIAAEVGASAVRDDVSVEITGVSDGHFSYRVSGPGHKVLEVRGLGAFGRVLPVRRAWTSGLIFDAGRVGARSVRGAIEDIEVIFSVEETQAKYAFQFDSGRPGSDQEDHATQSTRFVEYSPVQYQSEFGPRFGVPIETNPPPRAQTTAGPFTLALRDAREGERLLEVLAPDIPNLSFNLTALEMKLEPEASLFPLYPRYRFGRSELTCALSLEDPEPSLQGELILRLARNVDVTPLPVLEPGRSIETRGVRLEVTELARERFTVRIEGDVARLVAVQALNADGDPLVVEPLQAESQAGATVRSFRVNGQPTQLEVQVAETTERLGYPFQLRWPATLPAAPAP